MPPLGPVRLPTMYRVRQSFQRPRLEDIPDGVRKTLAAAGLPIKRGDTVAVGAGSRGIANIGVVVRAAVDWLKEQGARPFVFPAMGSHGGATAEGQRSVLGHYGITEAAMGCEVRASMDVVQVGEALGLPVWLDRTASEADWIGVINRVKPHTDFKGSIESGLFKMMTIGLGKYQGATQYHRANVNHGYETVITAVGREMLAKARIGFGLGILENGYDETAWVEAFNAADLEAGERRLLKDARSWMARLPISPLDVLVVEEIGKNVSGAGMDTNVIGRPSNPHEPFPADPKVLWIVALDLTEESQGNATGIGNADFTTRRLAEKIDWKPTAINTLTACAPNGAKLPLVFESDREAVENALNCIGLTPPERARVIRIRSTLVLGEIECSEALLPEIAKRPDLTVVGEGRPLAFDAAGRIEPLLAH
ncbi:MAG TPA: [Fe-S]-binding protein [Candidatus Limnocylindria bacterium]|nr:[Fe-S]-binding protein [Candidatus Limnocylindria bacterium]